MMLCPTAIATYCRLSNTYVIGDAFHTCAAAVEDYGETLSWARGRAGDAIDLWAAGHHQAAGEVLADARRQVDSAGDSAAAAVAIRGPRSAAQATVARGHNRREEPCT